MSKYVRINDANYKLSVNGGGTITLDTGYQAGNVIITGDLTVRGQTTTVESENLRVKDNIIIINDGETGAGVTLLTSGILIDRGSFPNVSILFDETVSHLNPVTGQTVNGTFVFKNENNYTVGIKTNSIDTGGENLALISSGDGVITVTGTNNYEQNVLNYSVLSTSFDVSTYSRLNDIATIYTTIPHGFIPGTVINVFNYSDPSFSGSFITILTVPSLTSFTYSNPGPTVALGAPNSALGNVRPSSIRDEDYVPNMKAVADFLASIITSYSPNRILENDTKVQAYDLDTSGFSAITFNVDNSQKAIIDTNAFKINTDLLVDYATTMTGDLAVNGGDLTTTALTFNLVNSGATAVNFAGAATTISIGAATGTLTIKNENTVLDGDLAVNGGDIITSSETLNIGNTALTNQTLNLGTAATENLATKTLNLGTGGALGSITNVNIGSSEGGVTTINSGSIVGSLTSQDLFNTVATTINFGGEATEIQVGATTGFVNIKSTDNSTDSATGALTVAGGVGIASDLNVGGFATITNDLAINGGNLTSTSPTFNIASSVPTIYIGQSTGTTVINNINITDNKISDLSSDNLVFDSVLSIANKSVDPTSSPGYVKVYSKNIPGPGGTGLFFVNTQGTKDELISKTKSILYSIIF